jgi:hypothetical protein
MEVSHLMRDGRNIMAEIKIKTKLIPPKGKPLPIYRLATPAVNEKALRELATRLGMQNAAKGGALKSDPDTLGLSDGHYELTMHRASGAVRFIDNAKWQVDDRKSNLKIEDAAASRLAQGIARKYKLAPAAEMKFLKAARLHVGEATSAGKEASDRIIDVGVALQRLVEKTPVDGPGGKIIVYFNAQNELTGFQQTWRTLAGVHKRGASYRSPESAVEDMARHFSNKRAVIEVQEVRFGYFEEGPRSNQRYLQPAYVIFGLLSAPEGGSRKRTIYVSPALTNNAGAITPALGKKPSQRKRPDADTGKPR